MAVTYEPIATTTLTNAAATINFTSIPNTYTDLILVVSASATNGGSTFYCRVNDDSANNYCTGNYNADGTTTGSPTSSMTANGGNGFAIYGWKGYAAAPATAVVNFFNYSNTSVIKTIIATSGQAPDSSTATVEHNLGWWNQTAAINKITMRINAAYNYEAGSTFTLYGILRA